MGGRQAWYGAIVAAWILAAVVSARAAESAYVTVKPDSARIGEPIVLTLHVTADDLSSVSVSHGFDDSEDSTWTLVAERGPRDTITTDGRLVRQFGFQVAAFRTGKLEVPPFRLDVAGVARDVEVPPITIQAVLGADDTTTEPRDIKPPMALPVPQWIYVAAGAVGAILLAALVWALWMLVRGRVSALVAPPATPDEWALRELDALEQERLVEQKRINEFYTRLSGILRFYLGRILGMPVLDMTTSELLGLLPDTPLSEEARRLTGEILDESDLVKFAKWNPDSVACRRALDRSRRLVDVTRPLLAPPPEPPQDGPPTPAARLQPAAPRSAAPATEART